eukprot:TRINITY_DN90562_c0_g1_i1.p1 TRINITY_DN90562_c0_g1~~TRINITY_DN90562_c0_g1_i1.p1  ORF type:complete len:1111 (-),score=319.47 TRINITY_DN90562_c0_g1_i1:48-3380(-)
MVEAAAVVAAAPPPFGPDALKLEVDVNRLTQAITWLTQQLQVEQSARLSLEARVQAAASAAQRAVELASNRVAGEEGEAAAGEITGPAAEEIKRLQQMCRYLQRSQEQIRKEQESRERTKEELLGLRLDEIRHDLTAKAPQQSLEDLRDALSDEVKDLIQVETRSVLRDRLARETEHLRTRLDRTTALLMQRLDSFAEQFGLEADEAFAEAALFGDEPPAAAENGESKEGGVHAADAGDGQPGDSSPGGVVRESSSSVGPRGSRSPGGLPAVQQKLRDIEERLAAVEANGGGSARRSRVPTLDLEGKLSLASVGDGQPLTITTPINPQDLRAELIEWVEGQIDAIKASFPNDAEARDAIVKATDKLRDELKEWLTSQRLGGPPSHSSASVGGSPTNRKNSGDSLALAGHMSSPDSIAQAVAQAVQNLKEEVEDWLEARVGLGGPATGSEAPSQDPTPRGTSNKTELTSSNNDLLTPRRKASHGQGGNKDVIGAAVATLRKEVGEWLDSQLKEIREAIPQLQGEALPPIPEVEVAAGGGDQGTATAAVEKPPAVQTDGQGSAAEMAAMGMVRTPTGDLARDPQSAAKWFQSQLQDLRNELAEARQEAMEKAVADLRKDVRAMLLDEVDNHMYKTNVQQPGRHASVHPANGMEVNMQDPFVDAGAIQDENGAPASPDGSMRSPTQRRGSKGPEDLEEDSVKATLMHDEEFLAALANLLLHGDGVDGVGWLRQASHLGPGERSLSKDGGRSLEGDDATSSTDGKKPPATLGDLAKRIIMLEDLVGAGEAAADGSNSIGLVSVFQVADELRRLKARHEYLERLAPAEVQQTLAFFEPLNDSSQQSAGEPGSLQQVIERVYELQQRQEDVRQEAKDIGDTGRREMGNISLALKGLQKDSEMSSSKISDLRRDLTSLKSRIEAALPQVLKTVEEVGKRAGIEAEKTGAEALRAVCTDKEALENAVPHPFVSQKVLSQQLDDLKTNMTVIVDALKNELTASVKAKADGEYVRGLAELMAKQEQQQWMKSTLHDAAPQAGDPKAGGGLHVSGGQGKLDERAGWVPQHAPQPSFPQHAGPSKDLRPLGAGLQRNSAKRSETGKAAGGPSKFLGGGGVMR